MRIRWTAVTPKQMENLSVKKYSQSWFIQMFHLKAELHKLMLTVEYETPIYKGKREGEETEN